MDETNQNIERKVEVEVEVEAIVADLIGALRAVLPYTDAPATVGRVATEALERAFAFQDEWVSTPRIETHILMVAADQ